MDFLGRIRKLDSSLQRGLDNGFARVFGGMVVPNELEECLKQEIEDFLMQDVDGRSLAPNDFRIGISPKDYDNLMGTEPTLPQDLANRMSRYCRNNGWSLSGSVSVRLEQVDVLHTGQLKTASSFVEGYRDLSGYVGGDDDRSAAGQRPPTPPAGFRSAAQAPAAPEATGQDADALAWSSASLPAPEQDAAVEGNATQVAPPRASSSEEHRTTATLLLQDGSNRTFELRPGSSIIGRGTSADFRLPDTGVSRSHAEIAWDGTEAVLTDMQSTNGTMVNDTPVESWLLADGDIISMGHSVMEFRLRR